MLDTSSATIKPVPYVQVGVHTSSLGFLYKYKRSTPITDPDSRIVIIVGFNGSCSYLSDNSIIPLKKRTHQVFSQD